MALSQSQLQHMYLRTGFGENATTIAKRLGQSKTELVERLFSDSRKLEPITTLSNPLSGKEISNLKMLRLASKSRKQTVEVNLNWVHRMAESKAQLREKMTFFWHNHFATKTTYAYLMQEQNNTLRKHAIGNFREMLHAMAQDPAMLLFLNNQQNKKRKPNENFAREVMELFTLGEGNYTENDIKEAARAFTGWQVNKRGKFEINPRYHDTELKTIFGKTGNFGGADVLDMLLENKVTARHISSKLYRFLINEKTDEQLIDKMADVFYNSDYDIEKLLKFILHSNAFYAQQNIGTRIATPTELIVRYLRLFKLKFKNDKTILAGQRALGQILLFPPSVAGWSQQREWIDSSSLLYRMRLPLLLFGSRNSKGNPSNKSLLQSDWSEVISPLLDFPKDEQTEVVIDMLIQCSKEKIDRKILTHFSDDSEPRMHLTSLIKNTMALPEFQLI